LRSSAANYDADDCLLLRPINITEKSASIQALSASQAATKAFEADFRDVNGFPAQVSTVGLSQQQCELVNFFHRVDPSPVTDVKATLSKPVIAPGENVSLRIDGAGTRHVELLAVEADGSVRNLTHLAKRDGDRFVLDAPVQPSQAKGNSQQIIVGIVTPERLEISAALAQGVASSAIFSSLANEIERKRLAPELVLSVVQFR